MMFTRVLDWLDGDTYLSKYIKVSRRGKLSVDPRHYLESPKCQAQIRACQAIADASRGGGS